MSDEAKKAEEKIEQTIEEQKPAIKESEWADLPDLTEQQEKELAAAAQSASAGAKFDDTSHADDGAAALSAVEKTTEELPVKQVEQEIKPAKQDQEPEFDLALIAAAGLASADEAKIMFGTPKALENAVRLMDQRAINVAEAVYREHVAEQEAQQKQLPDGKEKADEFQMPAAPEGEEWDEATVLLVKGLHDQLNAQLKNQQALLEEQKRATEALLEERRQSELRRYVDEFDGFVDKLDESWKPLLGKGSGFALKQDSLELRNRVYLDSVAKQLEVGRAHQGLPELPRKELLTRAIRVAFPQKQEQEVRTKIENEVSKRQGLMTPRPSGRSTAAPKTGDQAAVSRAQKWYADRGMAPMPNEDEDYDEI